MVTQFELGFGRSLIPDPNDSWGLFILIKIVNREKELVDNVEVKVSELHQKEFGITVVAEDFEPNATRHYRSARRQVVQEPLLGNLQRSTNE